MRKLNSLNGTFREMKNASIPQYEYEIRIIKKRSFWMLSLPRPIHCSTNYCVYLTRFQSLFILSCRTLWSLLFLLSFSFVELSQGLTSSRWCCVVARRTIQSSWLVFNTSFSGVTKIATHTGNTIMMVAEEAILELKGLSIRPGIHCWVVSSWFLSLQPHDK